MKNFSIALIAIIFASGIVQVAGTTYTCATHPIFLLAQELVGRVVSGDAEATKVMKSVADAFSANTPAVLTAADLGACSQFAGEQTCCTKAMVDVFDVAAVKSVALIQASGTSVQKLIYVIKKVLSANSCNSPMNAMTNSDFLMNQNLVSLKTYYGAGQAAKTTFSKVIAGLNRGALCSVCAGVDKISSYYSSPNLLIDQTNNQALAAALNASFTSLAQAINNTSLLDAVIDELLTQYVGDCSSKKTQIKADIKTIYGTNNAALNDVSGNPKCSGQSVFTSRLACESAQNGDSSIESEADKYTPSARVLRNLADSKDATIAPSGGLKVFTPAASDNVINATGDYQVAWPTVKVTTGTTTGGSNGGSNDGNTFSMSTSMSRIHFLACALLVVVFAL